MSSFKQIETWLKDNKDGNYAFIILPSNGNAIKGNVTHNGPVTLTITNKQLTRLEEKEIVCSDMFGEVFFHSDFKNILS